MGFFSKKPEAPIIEKEEPKKILIGVNPELVNKVKDKVKRLKDEKSDLAKKYDELTDKMSAVEAKCEVIEKTFTNFKEALSKEFMIEAKKSLTKEMKSVNDSISNNHNRTMKNENELSKIGKELEEQAYYSSFQDYYQLIKLCIYLMTNAEPDHQDLVTLILQTVRSLVDDMRRNGFWETGRDAIITSLLNLKTYWRARDERVEAMIGLEVEALEKLR